MNYTKGSQLIKYEWFKDGKKKKLHPYQAPIIKNELNKNQIQIQTQNKPIKS